MNNRPLQIGHVLKNNDNKNISEIEILDSNNETVLWIHTYVQSYAKTIIEVVNEHDLLATELKKYKSMYEETEKNLIDSLVLNSEIIAKNDALATEVDKLKEVVTAYEGLDTLQLSRLRERDEEIKRLKEVLKQYQNLINMDNGAACDRLIELVHEHEKIIRNIEDGE